uniref:Uncharacterized protein n=1 Tax=Solanum lycopersicum TaxID=4081 RepID=A0A3Q7H8Y7_SOLLC
MQHLKRAFLTVVRISISAASSILTTWEKGGLLSGFPSQQRVMISPSTGKQSLGMVGRTPLLTTAKAACTAVMFWKGSIPGRCWIISLQNTVKMLSSSPQHPTHAKPRGAVVAAHAKLQALFDMKIATGTTSIASTLVLGKFPSIFLKSFMLLINTLLNPRTGMNCIQKSCAITAKWSISTVTAHLKITRATRYVHTYYKHSDSVLYSPTNTIFFN